MSAPHVERYFVRVDAELERLGNVEACRQFLNRERAKWIERARVFMERVDSGQCVPFTVTIFDYHATFAGLDARVDRYRGEAA